MSKMLTEVNHNVLNKLKQGIDKVANAVKSTLGPSGNNVMIETLQGPIITKDGVTVARKIILEDKVENLACNLIKQIAVKTVDEAGDGTTTSTILAQSLFDEGCKNLPYINNKIQLKREIDNNINKVVDIIKKYSKDVSLDRNGDNLELINVATISANGDKEMGKVIVDAFKLVGKEGIISVEESASDGYSVDKTEGLQVDSGFVNPYFMTDTSKLKCEFKNPLIMLYNGELNSAKEIESVLVYVVENKSRPIVIFADGFSDSMQEVILKNKFQGAIQICLNKVSSYGSAKDAIYDDISAVTGAKVLDKNYNLSSNSDVKNLLGSCSKISINRSSTDIISHEELDKTLYNEVVLKIQNMIKETTNKNDLTRLNERLGKLVGGVAIISVGAKSVAEINEKKDRIDDSVCATRSALEEGILPGGGSLLYIASTELKDDGTIGYKVVREALKSPLKTLCSNCGKSFEYVEALLNQHNKYDIGLDFSKDNYNIINLLENGIMDPTKVTRVALESAGSIVGLLLTTDYTVTLKEELDQDSLV